MAYNKYKKVKANKTDSSMKNVDRYVDNEEKTSTKKEKSNDKENISNGAVADLDHYAE